MALIIECIDLGGARDVLHALIGLTALAVMFMLPCTSLFGLAKIIEAFVNFPTRGRFLGCMPDFSS